MRDRAPSQRLWLLAGAAVIVAVAVWIWAVHARATAAAPSARGDAAIQRDGGPAADAHVLTGTPLAIANGVKLLVPPGYTSATVDDQDVSASDGKDVKLVVGVRTDAQLDKLSEPKQAALDYGKENSVELTALVMHGPDRMLASYQATQDRVEVHHWLFVFTRPKYRVSALLIVTGVIGSDPSIARLVDELGDGRVILP